MGTGYGNRYIKITTTDVYLSNPVFYIADSHFTTTNVPNGPPTYPVVQSWGAFSKEMKVSSGEVTIFAGVEMVAATGTGRQSFSDWYRIINFMDAVVELYQWNSLSSTQALIWKGYIANVGSVKFDGGALVVDLLLSNEQKSLASSVSGDLVTKEDFANAPVASVGMMVPRVYGKFDNNLFSGANRNSLAYFGFSMSGYRGVVVDENQATLELKIRFSKNDGTSAAHTFAEPTADDPSTAGDLWVYDSAAGAYGLVDNASYSFTNDTAKLEVIVDASPKVFFFLRPSLKGSENAAGFTDLHKLIDSDAANFVLSTAGDHKWAFECPTISVNGKVKSVTVVADWDNVHATKQRKIRIGLWDVYGFGGANYLNGRSTTFTPFLGSSRRINFGPTATRYLLSDFNLHAGSNTYSEFTSGRFITRNAADALEANLQIKAEVIDIGGADAGFEDVRVHGLSLCVEVDYPAIPTQQHLTWWEQKYEDVSYYAKRDYMRFLENFGSTSLEEIRKGRAATLAGMEWFARGIAQKDDGGGTITGGAGNPILLPCDIARHLLLEAGESINTTAGTLGNFDDARASGGILGLCDETLMPLGPQNTKWSDAVDLLTSIFPMGLIKDDGVWNCIPRDLNPHSSRSYRSTSDEVWIGPDDIDIDDFEVTMTPWESVQNSVILKYSHGFPNREAGASYTYNNPISQMYYGKKETITIDEPHIYKSILADASVDSTPQVMAEEYGRRNGRRRLIVQAGLTQKFYDLKVGHVLEFKNLEDVGIKPFAHRCGLLDYYYQSAAAVTNYGDTTAFLTAVGVTGKIYIGLSQQVDRFIFPIGVAAAYTVVGAADGSTAWSYMGLGGALTALTGVTNGNGLKSTGVQTITFTRPRADLVYKQEITIGGALVGPCYWYTMDYNNSTVAGSTTDRISTLAIWAGRRFAALKIFLPQSAKGRYPKRRGIFQEVQ